MKNNYLLTILPIIIINGEKIPSTWKDLYFQTFQEAGNYLNKHHGEFSAHKIIKL